MSAQAVALIPVLEIGYGNQEVEAPTKYPYWEHTALWDAYRAACYTAAGFPDELRPYVPGSSFFPQCCGQLSDIIYWERLAAGTASSYEGHPAPGLRFTEDTVVLDFAVRAGEESFQPPPPALSVAISRPALQLAVAQANQKLTHFAQRLRAVNEAPGLGVPAIDKLLIWNDGKHD